MSDAKAGKILGLVGDIAAKIAQELGLGDSLGFLGAAAIAKKAAKLIAGGASVEQILKGMATMPDIVKPYRSGSASSTGNTLSGEDTARETPSSKRKDPG